LPRQVLSPTQFFFLFFRQSPTDDRKEKPGFSLQGPGGVLFLAGWSLLFFRGRPLFWGRGVSFVFFEAFCPSCKSALLARNRFRPSRVRPPFVSLFGLVFFLWHDTKPKLPCFFFLKGPAPLFYSGAFLERRFWVDNKHVPLFWGTSLPPKPSVFTFSHLSWFVSFYEALFLPDQTTFRQLFGRGWPPRDLTVNLVVVLSFTNLLHLDFFFFFLFFCAQNPPCELMVQGGFQPPFF